MKPPFLMVETTNQVMPGRPGLGGRKLTPLPRLGGQPVGDVEGSFDMAIMALQVPQKGSQPHESRSYIHYIIILSRYYLHRIGKQPHGMEVEWIFEVIDRFEQAQQAELSSKCESGFRSPP
jgi:hypothetical protein